jgi:hypothetical protein
MIRLWWHEGKTRKRCQAARGEHSIQRERRVLIRTNILQISREMLFKHVKRHVSVTDRVLVTTQFLLTLDLIIAASQPQARTEWHQ